MNGMRQLGHEVRGYVQDVFNACHQLMLSQETRKVAEVLLERSRVFNICLNMRLEECIMKVPSLNVLVVEDHEPMRTMLAMTLKRHGHNVIAEAITGPEMVKKAVEHQIDLIVFDIHLPGCDGLTALQQITELLQRQVPAVAVTGDQGMETADAATNEFLLGYLIKPIEPVQLMAAVKVAYSRFTEFQQIRQHCVTLEEAAERRKIIEKAKGILMRRYRWSEDHTFRSMQKHSMNNRIALVDLAKTILAGREVVFD